MPNHTNTKSHQTAAILWKKIWKRPNHKKTLSKDDASHKFPAIACPLGNWWWVCPLSLLFQDLLRSMTQFCLHAWQPTFHWRLNVITPVIPLSIKLWDIAQLKVPEGWTGFSSLVLKHQAEYGFFYPGYNNWFLPETRPGPQTRFWRVLTINMAPSRQRALTQMKSTDNQKGADSLLSKKLFFHDVFPEITRIELDDAQHWQLTILILFQLLRFFPQCRK